MSMKVPAIVAEAKKALESDMCVVIGLQTTGEVRPAVAFGAPMLALFIPVFPSTVQSRQ